MQRYPAHFTSPHQPPDWSRATSLRDFSLPWNPEEQPAFTEFQALWDQHFLHFRFQAEDHDLVLSENPDPQQRVLDSDRVELFLAQDPALQTYYCLEMEPRGTVLAYQAQHHRQMNWSWQLPSGALQLQSALTAEGYMVQGSLSLAALRQLELIHRHADEEYLLAGLFRADFKPAPQGQIRRHWSPWVIPASVKPDFHLPTAFGQIQLIREITTPE
jgi:Carbohydrate family 9 binding domain-like